VCVEEQAQKPVYELEIFKSASSAASARTPLSTIAFTFSCDQ
jgi:hypothetical protein